jgi:hypothetical protein
MDNPDLVDTFHTALRGPRSCSARRAFPGTWRRPARRRTHAPAGSAFVTWTQSDDSPFYCVEPWMGPANAPEHKTGPHLVPRGKRETFTVSVAVR